MLAPGDPFELSDSDVLLLAFDVAHWVGELDFAGADRDANGVIEIGDQNPELRDVFRNRVAVGIELYRDGDGDGAVDAQSVLPRSRRSLDCSGQPYEIGLQNCTATGYALARTGRSRPWAPSKVGDPPTSRPRSR